VQLALAWLLLAFALAGCSSPASRSEPLPRALTAGSKERLRALRAREMAVRNDFSPRDQPVWLDASGSDPYRIVARPGGAGFVGLLRGSKALVTLSSELVELQRVLLPEAPTALCLAGNGDAWVASRYDDRLVHVRLGAERGATSVLERRLPVAGVADLACGDAGVVYVLPADGSDLLTLDGHGSVLKRWPALAGGLRLQRRGHFLLETSLFERTLRVLSLGPRGLPTHEAGRIRHDGTLWAAEAISWGAAGGLLVAVAGVEDKPLVRAHGEFENIDSFVWLYELGRDGFERLAELDVSDYGVVVPKALWFGVGADALSLTVLGAGSGRMLRADWGRDLSEPPAVSTEPAPPGVSEAALGSDGCIAYASPLLDAWVKLDRAGPQIARVDPERRPEPDVRLGEALFFTELIAPENVSAGTHSRFSCETCHFEGGVDGRMHYTGRGNVSVVTKPLFGLANNRPHFSRAMDPDLSSVCHNEFRVAGAGSGTDPWFSLPVARFPWLHELGIARAELGPLELREALLRFLYAFSPAPNVNSQGRRHFSPLEAAGAEAFRQYCQSCHAARLLSDDSASEAPFAAWEGLIFARNAPLVWARADYAKTGVLPYVHERGTRVTSLRRLAAKPRYFTNGSAPDLANVLERFREDPAGALHAAPAEQTAALPLATRRALLAFLRLL
jgi:hypothetical protein